MTATKDEKRLALEIYQKHRDVFFSLAELLREEEGFPEGLTAPDDDKVETPLALTLPGGATIKGDKVADFFRNVFDYAFKQRQIAPSLPVKTSKKRFLIAEEPRHPNGSLFFNGKKYDLNGRTLFFEANISLPNARNTAVKLLKSLGIDAV